MEPVRLDQDALRRALSIRDLTDPEQGPHAMQLMVDDIVHALHSAWSCTVRRSRASPVVGSDDNYDTLRYAPDAVTRAARYTRYISPTRLLRTHTTAMVPPLLRELARQPEGEVLLACPGITYRRDVIDRTHTGEPHQMDLWRIRRGPSLDRSALREMIALVVSAATPGLAYRVTETEHPYTRDGLQIDVRAGADHWLEIGECGLAHPAVLRSCGLDGAVSGLAMGIGLDRLVMIRKGLDDVRLLRATDPRIVCQMTDLSPYRPVSRMPPIARDLSVAVDQGLDAETLGDSIRLALGDRAGAVEEVTILSETPEAAMPTMARARLGMRAGQKNVLIRIVLRDLERTLTHAEANLVRDEIYAAIHSGTQCQWAAR